MHYRKDGTKKTLRNIAIALGGLLATGFMAFVVGFWPGSTKDIEAIADQFQPGDEWVLESERINPPRLICLQADCGEVSRAWHSSNIPTDVGATVSAYAKQYDSGTNPEKVSCVDADRYSSCEVLFRVQELPVSLRLSGSGTTNRPTLSLQVGSYGD